MEFYVRLKGKEEADVLKVYSVSIDPDDATTLFLLYIPMLDARRGGWYWLSASDYEPCDPPMTELACSISSGVSSTYLYGQHEPIIQATTFCEDLTLVSTRRLCEELERREGNGVHKLDVPYMTGYSIEVEADCDTGPSYITDTGPAGIFIITD